MIKRLVNIGAFLFLLVLPGCATTQYDFGKTCIYHPAVQPSFSCQANEPGKEWV